MTEAENRGGNVSSDLAISQAEEAAETVVKARLRAEAVAAVAALLSAKRIGRIVVVDDDYRAEEQETLRLQDILNALDGGNIDLLPFAKKYSKQLALLDEDHLVGKEFVVAQLDSKWEELGEEAKRELQALLSAASPPEGDSAQADDVVEDDSLAIVGLGGYLPVEMDYRRMSLNRWQAENSELWEEGYPPTIVFFDRDFTKEQRAKDEGDKLVETLWREDHAQVYCGLLTHDPTDETIITAQLAERLGESGQVSVIAKHRLADPAEFARSLRVYLAIRDLQILRAHVGQALSAAALNVGAELISADFFTLMSAFQSSRMEGQFELDGLSRFGLSKFRQRVADQVRSADMSESLGSLRTLAKVKLSPFGLDRPADFDAMLRAKNFVTGTELNRLHSPVEVGDVLAVRTKAHVPKGPRNLERLYILLVQPCDLSLRSNGKRSNDVETVVLAEIHRRTMGEDGTRKHLRPNEFELGFYGDSVEPWVVDVMSTLIVTTVAIDACVLNSDGEGRLSVDMASPLHLAEGWEIRAADLKKWCVKVSALMKRYCVHIESAEPKADRARMRDLLGQGLTHSGQLSVHIDPDRQKMQFGIRRDGRIVSDVALSLLVAASQHQSRPDVENDLLTDIDLPPK